MSSVVVIIILLVLVGGGIALWFYAQSAGKARINNSRILKPKQIPSEEASKYDKKGGYMGVEPEYFNTHQMTAGNSDGDLYRQDCNRDLSPRNAMVVGIKDRYYWLWNPLQDMDELKCAVFPSLSGLVLSETKRKRIESSAKTWNECPANHVMTSIFDENNIFQNPVLFGCAQLSANFRVDYDQCTVTKITPPYPDWQGDFDPKERWTMQCQQLPIPSAFVGFLFSLESEAYWLAFKCCKLAKI